MLDHIDGDSSNNRRENLRLVCPNCDSQLETYKARNRGKGRAWRRQRYAEGKSY
ncbi:HNH endonuclease [Nocardioides ganghwensis]|uniref:HNH endonuclease n=1 Tax=Nocardioides ganghwensis TaxID=252230 RepID=UPI001A92F247|nr:HNH endonuclease [Nocardioides ganghwensis]